ncbi:MAG: dienelactone hydrolase family protein [Caulobacteraceae bacterium]
MGPDLAAAAPFYGTPTTPADVPKIKAAILINHGALDKNLAGGYPAQEAELKKNGVRYEGHLWPDSVHGLLQRRHARALQQGHRAPGLGADHRVVQPVRANGLGSVPIKLAAEIGA